jgi:DNA-directed RNA polymerase subunit M/transcription elongation factor TFIIS
LKIQVVSKYLSLAEEGLVQKMECPLDQGLLMPNQDNDDQIFLYCLSCEYKKVLGFKLYNQMKEAINAIK